MIQKKAVILALALGLCPIAANCQVHLKGQVLDLFTKKPIPHAMVTTVSTHQKVEADSLGMFTLTSNPDTLFIEAVGYTPKKLYASGTNDAIWLEDKYPIFVMVDEPFSYPGGLGEFVKYLKQNFKYAASLKKNDKLLIDIVIDTSGFVLPGRTSMLKPKNSKSAFALPAAEEAELIRVIEQSPRWIPAKQRGNKVRQRMAQLLIF